MPSPIPVDPSASRASSTESRNSRSTSSGSGIAATRLRSTAAASPPARSWTTPPASSASARDGSTVRPGRREQLGRHREPLGVGPLEQLRLVDPELPVHLLDRQAPLVHQAVHGLLGDRQRPRHILDRQLHPLTSPTFRSRAAR